MSSPKHYSTFKVAQTSALATSLEVSSEGALLCRGYGRIDSTAASDDYYIQFVNSSSLPVDGVSVAAGSLTFIATPFKLTHTNGVDTTFSFDFGPEYVKSKDGIYLVPSTTEFSKTIIGTAWLSATVFYR
jgi:hypothetical protein|tara:strand:- start:587 stop:976 length:390 start_codon:yes stop_codon:yes gene_type:complete